MIVFWKIAEVGQTRYARIVRAITASAQAGAVSVAADLAGARSEPAAKTERAALPLRANGRGFELDLPGTWRSPQRRATRAAGNARIGRVERKGVKKLALM
jgi:hypothetical protein